MANDQAWDLDFSGTTTENADLSAGSLPNGWYKLKLVDVNDDNESGAKILDFVVCHGPMSGCKQRERLNNPKFADTPDKVQHAKAKATCYASRLGLVSKEADGKSVQKAFSAAIGKEMVAKIQTREYNGKDYTGIANFGLEIYPIGHPKMPAEAYTAIGLTPPASAPKAGESKSAAAGGERVPATPPPASSDMAKQVWG